MLRDAVRAVELDTKTVAQFRPVLRARLVDAGIGADDSAMLVEAWIKQEEFLLAEFDQQFDFVVGNPTFWSNGEMCSTLSPCDDALFPNLVAGSS